MGPQPVENPVEVVGSTTGTCCRVGQECHVQHVAIIVHR
jgi:hypothetical protein